MWDWIQRKWVDLLWATYDPEWGNTLAVRLLGLALLVGAGGLGLFHGETLLSDPLGWQLVLGLAGVGMYLLVRGPGH